MTGEKIIEVIQYYQQELEKRKIVRKKVKEDKNPTDEQEILEHIYAMTVQILEFMQEGGKFKRRLRFFIFKYLSGLKVGKIFRWLGFIQCGLWVTWMFMLEDLKNHSRPDKQ